MAMVPFLFLAGVVFAYFLVLPNAINFLQNFNDDNYDILLQAQDYYQLLDHGPDRDGHRSSRSRSGSSRSRAWGSSRRAQLRKIAPLRDPRDRGRGHAAARPGPGDDADR